MFIRELACAIRQSTHVHNTSSESSLTTTLLNYGLSNYYTVKISLGEPVPSQLHLTVKSSGLLGPVIGLGLGSFIQISTPAYPVTSTAGSVEMEPVKVAVH